MQIQPSLRIHKRCIYILKSNWFPSHFRRKEEKGCQKTKGRERNRQSAP